MAKMTCQEKLSDRERDKCLMQMVYINMYVVYMTIDIMYSSMFCIYTSN